MASPPVDDIVEFYLAARQEAQATLFDGANQKPQYNLRTLSRALEYTRTALPHYGFLRSLYDGFSMCFLTLLDVSFLPRPTPFAFSMMRSAWSSPLSSTRALSPAQRPVASAGTLCTCQGARSSLL